MFLSSAANLLRVMVVAAVLQTSGALAQTSGSTMRVIYAFAAGGSGDGLARLVTDRLGAVLGVPAIVEIIREPSLRARIEGLGLVPTGTDGATFDLIQ